MPWTHGTARGQAPGSVVLSSVLAVICLASAGADFARVPRIVQSLEHLNVPTRIMPVLGAIKVVGALVLLIGLSAATFLTGR